MQNWIELATDKCQRHTFPNERLGFIKTWYLTSRTNISCTVFYNFLRNANVHCRVRNSPHISHKYKIKCAYEMTLMFIRVCSPVTSSFVKNPHTEFERLSEGRGPKLSSPVFLLTFILQWQSSLCELVLWNTWNLHFFRSGRERWILRPTISSALSSNQNSVSTCVYIHAD